MARHNQTGKEGELSAIDYLLQNNYEVIHTNWRFGKKEIDIIARKNDLFVFVEVKTRSTSFFGEPEESVTPAKQRFLIEAANAFLENLDFRAESRFDVISIVGTSIRHIEEAFIPMAE
jgi:putative endonuclease